MNISVDYDYTLDFSCYESFYYKKSVSPKGVPPRACNPSAGGCWVSRGWHGLLFFMNMVERTEKPVTFDIGGGKQFVALKQYNDETCVNFSKLIGFSNGIKFKLLVSFSPGALACSSILTGVAVGTGLLLFECNGSATTHGNNDESFNYDRLIAWSRSATFEFVSTAKMLDCYINSGHLMPMKSAKYVIDCDNGEGKQRRLQFLSLMKKIYLP